MRFISIDAVDMFLSWFIVESQLQYRLAPPPDHGYHSRLAVALLCNVYHIILFVCVRATHLVCCFFCCRCRRLSYSYTRLLFGRTNESIETRKRTNKKTTQHSIL